MFDYCPIILYIFIFQAVLKKIKTLRLTHLTRQEDVKIFLKKIMALAFLPAPMISVEYFALKNALPAPLQRQFASFFAYYERQWLQRVKPTGFTVYRFSRRTNNVIESYNSVLKTKIGIHPSAWAFIGESYNCCVFWILKLWKCVFMENNKNVSFFATWTFINDNAYVYRPNRQADVKRSGWRSEFEATQANQATSAVRNHIQAERTIGRYVDSNNSNKHRGTGAEFSATCIFQNSNIMLPNKLPILIEFSY